MDNDKSIEYVYVMSNPSFSQDTLKIGWTKKNPTERARELFTTGIPTQYTVEFVISTPSGLNLERQIHSYMDKYRLAENREFFKLTKDEIRQILTDELHLELMSESDILDIPIECKSKSPRIVCELSNLCDSVHKNANDFLNKLKKNKTELRFVKENNKIYASVYHFTPNDESYKYDINCLCMGLDSCGHEQSIINKCYLIGKDIEYQKKTFGNLIDNYEKIKDSIGGAQMRSDSIYFKKRILQTQTDINALLNNYEWTF